MEEAGLSTVGSSDSDAEPQIPRARAHYVILYKGFEHMQVSESKGAPGTSPPSGYGDLNNAFGIIFPVGLLVLSELFPLLHSFLSIMNLWVLNKCQLNVSGC